MNNYSYAAHNGVLFYVTHQRALAKVLILTTGIFPAWSLNKFLIFFFFSNCNILFQECSKKDQTYISDLLTLFEYILRIKIKNKCENEDDLDPFLNGSNFIRNWIIVPMLLIKAIIFTSYSPEGICFGSRSMNMTALVKVLILTIEIFLSLVLRNYYSLKVL